VEGNSLALKCMFGRAFPPFSLYFVLNNAFSRLQIRTKL